MSIAETAQKAQQQINKVHHRLGASPLINWLLVAGSLFLWACASVVQVQTSEYLALGSQTRVAGVDWNILSQPLSLITGHAPITYATSWLYAWIVELVTLVFAMALGAAVAKIAAVNPRIVVPFIIGGLLLMTLNGWADYSSSPGANWLVQFLIALAIGGMVVIGLPLGIGLIERGFEEL